MPNVDGLKTLTTILKPEYDEKEEILDLVGCEYNQVAFCMSDHIMNGTVSRIQVVLHWPKSLNIGEDF